MFGECVRVYLFLRVCIFLSINTRNYVVLFVFVFTVNLQVEHTIGYVYKPSPWLLVGPAPKVLKINPPFTITIFTSALMWLLGRKKNACLS